MKRFFSWVLSGILIVSSTLFLGIGIALADDTSEVAPATETLATCFTKQVMQEKDVHACDSYLKEERSKIVAVDLFTAARCNKLKQKVEATKPEYLRLYDVRDCFFFIEGSPFWTSIYYGEADAACKYDQLYNEYVCK